jgi:hypothetical protein
MWLRWAFASFIAVFLAMQADARAQMAQAFGISPISAADPSAFAETVSRQVSTQGTDPIRATMQQLNGGAELPIQLDAAFTIYERQIANQDAQTWRKIEDLTLSDSVRKIYYLHVFNGAPLFTRYDFVNAGRQGWLLTGVFFASAWDQVASPVTPGFASSLQSSSPPPASASSPSPQPRR